MLRKMALRAQNARIPRPLKSGDTKPLLPARVFPISPQLRCVNLTPRVGARARLTSRPAVAQEQADVSEPKTKYSSDGLDIVAVDPQLGDYKEHLAYRYRQFRETKAAIEKAEGSLENFAKGYERLGFTREKDAIVYREWAPAAQAAALIGDFNGWTNTWMTKDKWGVWEVRLPDGPDGKPAIPHASRVKIRLQHSGGWWVDRVPAFIRWATIPPNQMGAKYDGIYWDPPKGEKYEWKYERPPKPHSLRIYEAHVGMSAEQPKVSTYTEFRDNVLPRIKAGGYTAIQLMAVQEHAYYASFGYHVTNPFAVSSRSGTPEELKSLVDEAHRLGLYVLLDVVHSHISSNADDGLAGFDMGQGEEANYFCSGERGYHRLWDSRCLNYKGWEVTRYLLSNLRWWLDEYKFDGFRFDGVTSMLYHHHGINTGFSGNYHEYFGMATNVDAVVYLMLANDFIHNYLPQAITVAEDVSGMPALCRPVSEGGVGFDYRLGMAIPDRWIQLLKHVRDEHWSMRDLVATLCNRRYSERTIGYAESHDQALVGDQTIAFRLMGPEMYEGMSALTEQSGVVARGVALHKMIRLVTMALGGEGYLTFMGNEFGHPEWIDFPRDGNGWSNHYARRQWSLGDSDHLLYSKLLAWDKGMMELDDRFDFLANPHQWVTHMDEEEQVLVFERGPLLFVFNWSPNKDYEGYKVAAPVPGKWRVALDSDTFCFGGKGRVGWEVDHFTSPVENGGLFHDRNQFMYVLAPARTAVAYYRVDEAAEAQKAQQQQQQKK
mmetsp:Transcript_7040/g.15465  ORF Transcript_7040/g.15465 Transcript_7040/m.15465 type:complete len:773 (+) Transcript_7040:158-2476(+)